MPSNGQKWPLVRDQARRSEIWPVSNTVGSSRERRTPIQMPNAATSPRARTVPNGPNWAAPAVNTRPSTTEMA